MLHAVRSRARKLLCVRGESKAGAMLERSDNRRGRAGATYHFGAHCANKMVSELTPILPTRTILRCTNVSTIIILLLVLFKL